MIWRLPFVKFKLFNHDRISGPSDTISLSNSVRFPPCLPTKLRTKLGFSLNFFVGLSAQNKCREEKKIVSVYGGLGASWNILIPLTSLVFLWIPLHLGRSNRDQTWNFSCTLPEGLWMFQWKVSSYWDEGLLVSFSLFVSFSISPFLCHSAFSVNEGRSNINGKKWPLHLKTAAPIFSLSRMWSAEILSKPQVACQSMFHASRWPNGVCIDFSKHSGNWSATFLLRRRSITLKRTFCWRRHSLLTGDVSYHDRMTWLLARDLSGCVLVSAGQYVKLSPRYIIPPLHFSVACRPWLGPNWILIISSGHPPMHPC